MQDRQRIGRYFSPDSRICATGSCPGTGYSFLSNVCNASLRRTPINGQAVKSVLEQEKATAPQLEHGAKTTDIVTVDARYLSLEAMVNHIPDYIYAKDREGRFLYANQAIVHGNGLSSVDEIIGLTDFDLHGQKATDAHIDEIEQRVIFTGEPDLGFAERAMRGGPDRWLMMSRVPLRNEAGEIIGVVGASRDITALKASERMMHAQARILEMIVGAVSMPFLIREFATLIEGLGEGIRCAIMLLPMDQQALQLTTPSIASLPEALKRAFKTRSAASITSAMVRLADQDPFFRCVDVPAATGGRHGVVSLRVPAENQNTALSDFLVSAIRMLGIAIDRRLAEQKIHFLAEHDVLTGLPNRSFIEGHLARILEQAERSGRTIALGFLDLDNFKQINDTLGHGAGDRLIKHTAARIASVIGADDLVARIGGDEFILVLQESGTGFSAALERIRLAVAEPVTIDGNPLQVTCSIGISLFPKHGKTTSDLFAAADLAMYEVKENGRNGIQLFSEEIAQRTRRKFQRSEELRRAVASDEFILHYQPQVNLQTGRINGVEALVRWMHPVEGLLPPGEFISLAEETGLIVDLGYRILDTACRQLRKWQNAGLGPITVGVNMSARQFQMPGLTENVGRILRENGLSPECLEIEVTETLIMQDVDASVFTMMQLTDMGVSLALDDFGTGYSSLSMLKTLPLSRLKIDRSFLKTARGDARDDAIITTIIDLGRKLGLNVIAEGVETQEQADFLRKAGCEHGQGFFLGRPAPATTVEKLLLRAECAKGGNRI